MLVILFMYLAIKNKTGSLTRCNYICLNLYYVKFQNEKRIKTESGQSISATYKTNRYKRWLKTGRQHKEVDEEEEAEAANTREGRKAGGVKSKCYVAFCYVHVCLAVFIIYTVLRSVIDCH